jgi:phage recombination protein Bet
MSTAASKSLRDRFAERYGIAGNEIFDILKATAFRQRKPKRGDNDDDEQSAPTPLLVTDEELTALMVICEQYGLNPFTREIFAYPDKSSGGIVPVVSVDGWSRIINEAPQLDGLSFNYSEERISLPYAPGELYAWIEATIWRKDRSHPMVVREYAIECYREPFIKESRYANGKPWVVNTPWQTHPRRMLRHKSLIQCARLAFGFATLRDQDEAERIIDMGIAQEAGEPIEGQEEQAGASLMPRSLEHNPSQTANFIHGTQTAETVETIREVEQAPKASTAAASAGADYTAAPNRFDRSTRPAADAPADKPTTRRRRAAAPVAPTETNTTNGQPSMFTDDADPSGAPAPASASPSDPAGGNAQATPPATPVPANMLSILARKMETAGRNEVDMKAKFGFDLSGVNKANFAEVQAWASNI